MDHLIVAISGPPGSGKSTTAKLLQNLYESYNENVTLISMSSIARMLSLAYKDNTIYTGDKFPLEKPLMGIMSSIVDNSPNKVVIIEGMPRHYQQYIAFDMMYPTNKILLMLECDPTVAFNRMVARGDVLDDYSSIRSRFNNMYDYYEEMLTPQHIRDAIYGIINTTSLQPTEVASLIKERITEYASQRNIR